MRPHDFISHLVLNGFYATAWFYATSWCQCISKKYVMSIHICSSCLTLIITDVVALKKLFFFFFSGKRCSFLHLFFASLVCIFLAPKKPITCTFLATKKEIQA